MVVKPTFLQRWLCKPHLTEQDEPRHVPDDVAAAVVDELMLQSEATLARIVAAREMGGQDDQALEDAARLIDEAQSRATRLLDQNEGAVIGARQAASRQAERSAWASVSTSAISRSRCNPRSVLCASCTMKSSRASFSPT